MEVGMAPRWWWAHRRGARWSRHWYWQRVLSITHRRSPTSPGLVQTRRLSSPGLIVVTPRYVCHPVLDYASLLLFRTAFLSARPLPIMFIQHCPLSIRPDLTRPDADSCVPRIPREIRERSGARLFWQFERRSRRRWHCPSHARTWLTSPTPFAPWRHSEQQLALGIRTRFVVHYVCIRQSIDYNKKGLSTKIYRSYSRITRNFDIFEGEAY